LSRWLPARQERVALAAETEGAQDSALRVQVVLPKPASSTRALVLPGSIRPLQETTVYPRASGYIRKWYRDIGDRVKTDELLATIDMPELEQQLMQAKAQLAQAEASQVQAKASSEYSARNLTRYETLTPAGLTSQQELEKQRAQAEVDAANVGVAKANVDAQRANIERLMQLKSFGRVTAPFAGIVTSRSVETGALVSAGNSTPLFRITATNPVRIFAEVPQNVASAVRIDSTAQVTVREFPGRKFTGIVSRTAGALDSATRTMTTEVRVPNPDNDLLTGMYVEVALSLPTARKTYEIPATALLNDAAGLRVAVVKSDNTVHLVQVGMERDNGATLEIASGLEGVERIIRLVNAEITEGRRVTIAP